MKVHDVFQILENVSGRSCLDPANLYRVWSPVGTKFGVGARVFLVTCSSLAILLQRALNTSPRSSLSLASVDHFLHLRKSFVEAVPFVGDTRLYKPRTIANIV